MEKVIVMVSPASGVLGVVPPAPLMAIFVTVGAAVSLVVLLVALAVPVFPATSVEAAVMVSEPSAVVERSIVVDHDVPVGVIVFVTDLNAESRTVIFSAIPASVVVPLMGTEEAVLVPLTYIGPLMLSPGATVSFMSDAVAAVPVLPAASCTVTV